MANFASEQFADCNKWILEKHQQGYTYDTIRCLCLALNSSEEELEEELDVLIDDNIWPERLSLKLWRDMVSEMEANPPIPITIDTSGGIADGGASNNLDLPPVTSSWSLYKRHLIEDLELNTRSVNDIENSSKWILNHLKSNTRNNSPVKGLVYGSIQSGKTANMAGLISMAADYGWNIFIVLSGTIEALRRQTQERFGNDLQNSQGIAWQILDFSGEHNFFSAEQLHLDNADTQKSGMRYVTVCLKQKTRLKKLLQWLYANESRTARMRIIVIDDEADQASINTADILDGENAEEFEQARKEINRLIVNLVNGKTHDGNSPHTTFQAMNYLSFTATPYANVLNEKPGESLYPKDFIYTLPDPSEYFGPKIVFGNADKDDCPGLNIIRRIPLREESDLNKLHDAANTTYSLPYNYKRAVAWFIAAAAVLRHEGFRKPISMLIHTTNRVSGHFIEYSALNTWLKASLNEILELCEETYSDEKTRFDFNDFSKSFHDYGRLTQMPRVLPSFNTIRSEVLAILSEVSNIHMGDEGDLHYCTGIHLCIDNCQANRKADNGASLRIVYPTKSQLNAMEKAPVFIVLGGNTLSRGLTLEGLVCTYFARNSNQADTLMQMARWFGYRKNYELLQRIWMTENAQEKFIALANIDINLREEFDSFKERGLTPAQVGPVIQTAPEIVRFTLSSKKKTQMAKDCYIDFSGGSYELTDYEDDTSLSYNLAATHKLLSSLGAPTVSEISNTAFVWRQIEWPLILNFLKDFQICEHSSLKDNLPIFFQWFENLQCASPKFQTWNIAVSGKKALCDKPDWQIHNLQLPTIERTKMRDFSYINIGALRSGFDALVDIELSKLSPTQRSSFHLKQNNKTNLIISRGKFNLKDTPLLLLYRIENNGGRTTKTRLPPSTSVDLIGFSIIIPGDKAIGGKATAMHIDI